MKSSRLKRILSLLLCLACMAAVCGCRTAPVASHDKPKVVATIFPQYDFIRAIAGDLVELEMLIDPGSEVHGFDPTFSQIEDIVGADLFVYVGGESDAWVDGVLEKSGAACRTLKLVDCVTLLNEETVEGMQTEEGEACEQGAFDEHVWTSPQNAMRIVERLTEELILLLPEQEATLQHNRDAYLAKLSALDEGFQAVMQNAARTTVVFAERFPFLYLCRAYGITYYAALKGCSSNEEVSLKTIAFLIDKVNEEQLPAVFYIEFSSEKVANTIADATGVETLRLHSCHNVSKADFDNGVTYLDLMWQNVESLRKAVS